MTTIFNLGGTIALAYDEAGPVTLSGAELLGESDAELVELNPVQSNGLTWTHLVALRTELLAIVAAGHREAVVITGTDTVEDVGTFLHLLAWPDLRIGLLCSLQTATRGQRPPGINAALTWLHSATDSAVQLFVDGNPYPVPFEKRWTGERWGFAAAPDTLPRWRASAASQLDPVMPTVPVVPVGVGCEAWAAAVIESVPSAGLVLEAFGSGDVPPGIVASVRAYLAGGGQVVLTSLAPHGRVEPTYPGVAGTSHELLTAGCFGGGTLTARQARMRLAVALACGAGAAAREAFETYSPVPS